MSVNKAQFPVQIWDGLSPSTDDRKDDKSPDYEQGDQIVAELVATQEVALLVYDVLFPIGPANSLIGVDALGLDYENKTLIAGTGITILHAAGTITISSSTYAAIADEDISSGKLVFLKNTGHVRLAQTTDSHISGMSITSVLSGGTATYIKAGRVAWPGPALTVGGNYFLADSGDISLTPSGTGFVMQVGQAQSATIFDLEIKQSVRL